MAPTSQDKNAGRPGAWIGIGEFSAKLGKLVYAKGAGVDGRMGLEG
jgi:hypothetical protein